MQRGGRAACMLDDVMSLAEDGRDFLALNTGVCFSRKEVVRWLDA